MHLGSATSFQKSLRGNFLAFRVGLLSPSRWFPERFALMTEITCVEFTPPRRPRFSRPSWCRPFDRAFIFTPLYSFFCKGSTLMVWRIRWPSTHMLHLLWKYSHHEYSKYCTFYISYQLHVSFLKLGWVTIFPQQCQKHRQNGQTLRFPREEMWCLDHQFRRNRPPVNAATHSTVCCPCATQTLCLCSFRWRFWMIKPKNSCVFWTR